MKNNQLILLKNKIGLTPLAVTYPELVRKVKEALTAGRARAEAAVDREKARSYWEAGRSVHHYLLHGKDRARYGARLIPNLAESIGLSTGVVQDMHLFYRASIYRAPDKLPWTHYQLLLRVKDKKQRDSLAKQADEKNLTSRELEAEVRKIQQKASPSPDGGEAVVVDGGEAVVADGSEAVVADGSKKGDRSFDLSPFFGKKLIPKKGKFFTYQLVRPQNMHQGPGGYSLDLGFKIRHEIEFKGIRNPRPGEIVQVVRTKEDPAGDRYKVARGARFKRSDLYTYKAKAQIYHDADTFWVDIDLGFRNWNEQKLRLRGIDAEELGKTSGRKAAAYVKKVLSGVPFIVITISGRDKFGRPLTDVFYLEGAADREKVLREGKFLNQELLDLGLARRV